MKGVSVLNTRYVAGTRCLSKTGYLILRDGAISYNSPQMMKSYSIAQFEENHIICKKMLNSSKVNNEFLLKLNIFPILMLLKVIYH